jgi:hypothetical protein
MPDDSQKLWSSVGSAGVVNLPDIGKILFNQSVAQLGPASPVVIHTVEPSALPTQTITAIIRYGVVPVDGVYIPDSSLGIALKLRYRGGDGHVLAKLKQVNIETGVEALPILTFDSGPPMPASNDFQTQTSPVNDVELDFVTNAYYVELTLSLTEPRIARPPHYPPALSVVQLCFGQPIIQ